MNQRQQTALINANWLLNRAQTGKNALMPQDHIRYDILAQDALRGVIRKVLSEVAVTGYLPGDHHFFITFLTEAPGVRISTALKERYPEQMTIVVQHQFWGPEGDGIAVRDRPVLLRQAPRSWLCRLPPSAASTIRRSISNWSSTRFSMWPPMMAATTRMTTRAELAGTIERLVEPSAKDDAATSDDGDDNTDPDGAKKPGADVVLARFLPQEKLTRAVP
jgi:hypothetical protein